jgi:hypothetical protein
VADDGALRRAYAAVSEGSPPHVDDPTWERLACGELSAEERERALDHAARCAACGRILRALTHLAREARAVDPEAPGALAVAVASPPRARWVWGALAAAAAVLAVVALGPRLAPPGAVRPSGLRGGGVDDRPVPSAPRDEQAVAPQAFSWQGLANARRYHVELLDAAGERLWLSPEVEGTALGWPESVPAAPGLYYWRVTATLEPRGQTRASPLVRFEIRPSADR